MTLKELEETRDQLIRDLGKLEGDMRGKKDCCYDGNTRVWYMQFELMIYDLREKLRSLKIDK